MKWHSHTSIVFFFSNTDVNGRVLMHCFLISKENTVLQKIRCFAQNWKFCFVFSFKLFSIASTIFPVEVFADKYFVIFPFQIFLLWSTRMTPSASHWPKQFSQLQAKYLTQSKNSLAPKRQFHLYFFHFSLNLSHAQVVACACTGECACSTIYLGLSRTSRPKGEISTLQGEQNFRWMRNWHWSKSEERKAIGGGQQKMWWPLLVEGGDRTSPKSWDEHTGGSENPQGKSKDTAGHGQWGCLNLGADRMAAQAWQQPQGLLGGAPTPQKLLLHGWTRGPVGWEDDRTAIDMGVTPLGSPLGAVWAAPSLPLFFLPLSPLPVKSGYSGWMVALEINESKVPAGNFLQFSLWSLWIPCP